MAISVLPSWYDEGAASVANGSTLVTPTDASWGDDAIMPGDLFVILSQPLVPPQRIASVDSDGRLTLASPWPGTTVVAAEEYEIRYVGIIERSTAQTRRVLEEITVVQVNTRGLFYNFIGVTEDLDPGLGKLAINAVAYSDVTEVYLDERDANRGGRDVSGLINLWRPGTVITIRSLATTAFVTFQISNVSNESGYRKASVTFIGSDGTLLEGQVGVEWNVVGEGIAISRSGVFADRGLYDTPEAPAPAGFVYASINGADGAGPPTVLYQKKSATVGDWGPAIPFQGPESKPRVAVVLYDPGNPAAGERIWNSICDVPLYFPANLNAVNVVSRARADSAPTANAVFSIRKNGVQFATLTFPAGINDGVFAGSATNFAAGDQLSVVAPSPRDVTLARISVTISGTR